MTALGCAALSTGHANLLELWSRHHLGLSTEARNDLSMAINQIRVALEELSPEEQRKFAGIERVVETRRS